MAATRRLKLLAFAYAITCASAVRAQHVQGMQYVMLGVDAGLGNWTYTGAATSTSFTALGAQLDANFSFIDLMLDGKGIGRVRFGDQMLFRGTLEKVSGMGDSSGPVSTNAAMMVGLGGQAAFAVSPALDLFASVSGRWYGNYGRESGAGFTTMVAEAGLRYQTIWLSAGAGSRVLCAAFRWALFDRGGVWLGARYDRLVDVGAPDTALSRFSGGIGLAY